jgi:hypothetical protein
MVAARPLELPADFAIRIAPGFDAEILADCAAGRHPLQRRQPQAEPDRSVWRILSHALVVEAQVSDEQLHGALPGFSLEALAAARVRVAGSLFVCAPGPTTVAELVGADLDALLVEPSITRDEAIACGLMRPRVNHACEPSI